MAAGAAFVVGFETVSLRSPLKLLNGSTFRWIVVTRCSADVRVPSAEQRGARPYMANAQNASLWNFSPPFCLILKTGKENLLEHAQTAPMTAAKRRALFRGIDGV